MTAMAQIFAGGRSDPNLLDELQTILGSKQVFDTFRYDVRVALASAAHPAATGNQDITASGIAWQPRAAIVIMGRYAADDTLTPHPSCSLGFVDAARQYAMFFGSEDNLATTAAHRGGDATTARLIDTDQVTTLAEAVFVAFIAGGIRLNWTTVDASNRWRVNVVLLGGNDLRVRSDVLTLVASGSAVTVTDCGFKPNGVINANMGKQIPTAAANNAWLLGLGFGGRDHQCSQGDVIRQNRATSDNDQGINTAKGGIQTFNHWNADIAMIERGFTFTPVGTSVTDTGVAYLALGTGDVALWGDSIDSPDTAASAWSVSGLGFTPQWLFLNSGLLTAVDANQTAGTAVHGFHCADGFGNEFSYCMADEDNVVTSNANQIGDSQFLNVPELTLQANTEYDAANVQFTSDGWTIAAADIAVADAATHKWWAWAMEQTL